MCIFILILLNFGQFFEISDKRCMKLMKGDSPYLFKGVFIKTLKTCLTELFFSSTQVFFVCSFFHLFTFLFVSQLKCSQSEKKKFCGHMSFTCSCSAKKHEHYWVLLNYRQELISSVLSSVMNLCRSNCWKWQNIS